MRLALFGIKWPPLVLASVAAMAVGSYFININMAARYPYSGWEMEKAVTCELDGYYRKYILQTMDIWKIWLKISVLSHELQSICQLLSMCTLTHT